MRKAFTLIELLVVIAIIAILAAILFPVFAQAKAAAKKTASLSNCKQIGTAMFMYSASNNDGFAPGDSWGGKRTDAGFTFGNGLWWRPWGLLLASYIKNDDLLQDPLATRYNNTDPTFKSLYMGVNPAWGYNKTWLDPSFFTNGQWVHQTKSQGTLAQPANTVMFTGKFSQPEGTIAEGSVTYYGTWSFTTSGYVDPPICSPIPQYCFADWGTASGFWDGIVKNVYENGAFTGGVAPRANDGAIVVFADGHASRMAMGRLADGTNWNKTRTAASMAMVDESRYIWDDK